jgi:hypothetical protein
MASLRLVLRLNPSAQVASTPSGASAPGECCRPAYVIAPGAAKLTVVGAANLIAPGRPN